MIDFYLAFATEGAGERLVFSCNKDDIPSDTCLEGEGAGTKSN